MLSIYKEKPFNNCLTTTQVNVFIGCSCGSRMCVSQEFIYMQNILDTKITQEYWQTASNLKRPANGRWEDARRVDRQTN